MSEINESTMTNLFRMHGVSRWDLMLIGDGSGSGATFPCGWAVTIIDRTTGTRTMLVGGQNMGSITLAEMLPYLLALQYFDVHMRGVIHAGGDRGRPDLVTHIFTDSQHVAMAGQGKHARSKYAALWAGMDHFDKNGYKLNWHWLNEGRDNPFLLHHLMDEIAAVGRSRMMEIEQTSELYELLPPGSST